MRNGGYPHQIPWRLLRKHLDLTWPVVVHVDSSEAYKGSLHRLLLVFYLVMCSLDA